MRVGGVSRQFRDMSSVEQANVVPVLARFQRRYRAHLKQSPELIEAVKDLAHSRLQWADHPTGQMSPGYDEYQAMMRDRIHKGFNAGVVMAAGPINGLLGVPNNPDTGQPGSGISDNDLLAVAQSVNGGIFSTDDAAIL